MTEKETPSWGTELKQFTQDTTFHGVRYISDGPTIRRFLWILIVLGSTTAVTIMTIENIQKLRSNPKTVNVDVQYQDKLPFPSVTICNQNQIRLTEAYRLGVYDDLLEKYDTQLATDGLQGDMYTFVALCEDQVEKLLNTTKWTYFYKGVTTIGCQQLCTRVHNRTCSSLFYNRTAMSCTLLSATLNHLDNNISCPTISDMDSYRRIRKLDPDFKIICSFEVDGWCPLTGAATPEDIKSQTALKIENWKSVVAHGHTPPTDHTTTSEFGWYMQIGKTSNRNNYSSSSRTSFYPFRDMCLEVFYVQTGELAVGFTINKVTEDLNTETIFEVKPGELPDENLQDTLSLSSGSGSGSSYSSSFSSSSYLSSSSSSSLSSSSSSSYTSSYSPSSSYSSSGVGRRRRHALENYYTSSISDLISSGKRQQMKRWRRETSEYSSYTSSLSSSSYSTYDSSSDNQYSGSNSYSTGHGGFQVTFGTGENIEELGNLPAPAPVYKWTRIYKKLPDGIYQLELNTERPDVYGKTTGFVLDDLAIWPCADFERGCKRFSDGSDFQGRISTARGGSRCAPWTDILVDSMSTWATFTPSSASNYCRNLAKDPEGPGCYVKQPQGNYLYSYCTIPFCECTDSQFTCNNGQCVTAVTCNGVKECADGSDEGNVCSQLQTVSCDFESSYLCGYNLEHESTSKWQVTDISLISLKGVTNFLQGRDPMRVLQFLTTQAPEGDTAMATTPQLNTTATSCLSFVLFIRRHILDQVGRLRVYMSRSEKKILLMEDNKIDCKSSSVCGAWGYYEVPLPLGVYNIVFEATHGDQDTSSLLLDDVQVHARPCQVSEESDSTYAMLMSSDEEKAINQTGSCSFKFGDMCGYTTSSTNSLYGWDPVPTDLINDFLSYTTDQNGCHFTFWTKSGQFESPNYPSSYAQSDCSYTIKALPGSNITVSFLHFNLEYEVDCNYDSIYVEDKGPTPSWTPLYCGEHPAFNISYISNEVTVYFYADYYGNSDGSKTYGFHARFYVQPTEGEDYSVVTRAEYTMSTTKIYSRLISPALTYTTTQCMTVRLIVRDGLKIKKQMTDGRVEVLWKYDYTPQLPLSAKLISVAVSPGTFNLVFESSYLTKGRYSSVIFYIDISEGNCLLPDIIQPVGLSCEYLSNCGFRDVSKTGDRWIANIYDVIRINETAIDELYMAGQLSQNISLDVSTSLKEQVIDWYFNGNLSIGSNVTSETGMSLPVYSESVRAMSCGEFNRDVACLLTSPIVNVSEPHCLQFVYYVSSITSQIVLMGMDKDFNQTVNSLGVLQSNLESFDTLSVSEWKKAQVDLPLGIYRVGIAATDIVGSGETRIGATTVVPGNCGFAEEMQNLTAIETPSNWSLPTNDMSSATNTGNVTAVNVTNPAPLEGIISRKSIADQLNMRTFFEQAGHALEDLVVTCSWDGKTCEKDAFVPEHTELGLCYTFNPALNGTFESSRTGAQFGLNLVLNIEQYEHTPGTNTDAGVKIHLHSHEDIPTIEATGTAVPLAMHSLIAVTYTKTQSLSLPYSNCTKAINELEHYPGKDYTVARCRRLCDMKKATGLCGCKWAYQPGPGDVCQMDKYFSCLMPSLSNATNNCATCSDACTIKAFRTVSSSASLSSFSIDQFLGDKGMTAHIQKRYIESLNIAARANPNTLVAIIEHVQTIIAQLEQLLTLIKKHGTLGELSTFTYGKGALELFLQMVVTDVKGAFSDINLYQKEYGISLGQRRTGLANSLSNVERLVLYVLDLLDQKNFKESELEGENLYAALGTAQKHLTLIRNERAIARLEGFLSRLPNNLHSDSKKTCNDELTNVDALVSLLRDKAYNIYNGYAFEENEFAEMSLLYFNLTVRSINLQDCLGEYNKVLLETQKWLADNVFGSEETQRAFDLTLEFDFDVSQNEIARTLTKYKKILQEVSTNQVSQLDLAGTIDAKEVADIIKNIDDMITTMKTGLIDPLARAITNIQHAAIDTYKDVVTHLAHLEKHFPHNGTFSDRARKLKIFYQPYALADSYLNINFKKNEYLIEETYAIWKKDLDISNFVTSKSSEVLRALVKDYLREISDNLERTYESFRITRDTVVAELFSFQQELRDKALLSNIDASFIQKNLLKLDVYYGELRYESIEQQPAYGVLTFFIDLGGSMGLLIGASVLTLFEIFDFLLYTAFRMLASRRVRPKSSVVQVKSMDP